MSAASSLPGLRGIHTLAMWFPVPVVAARCAGSGRVWASAAGVRVIYFNRLENDVIYLLVIYAKTVRGDIPAHLLKAIQETIQHGNE